MNNLINQADMPIIQTAGSQMDLFVVDYSELDVLTILTFNSNQA